MRIIFPNYQVHFPDEENCVLAIKKNPCVCVISNLARFFASAFYRATHVSLSSLARRVHLDRLIRREKEVPLSFLENANLFIRCVLILLRNEKPTEGVFFLFQKKFPVSDRLYGS